MSILSEIRQAFAPRDALTIEQLASGLCALPLPKQRYQAPKQEAPQDMYTINEATKTYGFHSATAQRQSNGGCPELTTHDISLLMERDLWGASKNKAMHGKNARCKKCWHTGETEKEAGVILGKSESWVEKRYGTFSTALLLEMAETVI